jgi:hypothetical protein
MMGEERERVLCVLFLMEERKVWGLKRREWHMGFNDAHLSSFYTYKKREIRANVMLMLLIIGNHINLNIFLLCPIYGIFFFFNNPYIWNQTYYLDKIT